jgi:RNase H
MPIQIYTDGCCLANPGFGGYAAIIVNADGTHRELSGSEAQTTSNRMERKRPAGAVQVGWKFHGMRASSSRLDHPLAMRSRVSLSQA